MTEKNYNYGKLVNRKLVYAPNTIPGTVEDDEGNQISVQVINATAEQYAAQGWLPIRKSQPPEPASNGYYAPEYAEQNGAIVESYTLVVDEQQHPQELTPTEADRLEALEEAFLEYVLENSGAPGNE